MFWNNAVENDERKSVAEDDNENENFSGSVVKGLLDAGCIRSFFNSSNYSIVISYSENRRFFIQQINRAEICAFLIWAWKNHAGNKNSGSSSKIRKTRREEKELSTFYTPLIKSENKKKRIPDFQVFSSFSLWNLDYKNI